MQTPLISLITIVQTKTKPRRRNHRPGESPGSVPQSRVRTALARTILLCVLGIEAQDPLPAKASQLGTLDLVKGPAGETSRAQIAGGQTAAPALQPVNFSLVVDSPVATVKGRYFSVAWGDVNNDGFTDLFLGNAWKGRHSLFLNKGSGVFSAVTTGDLVTLPNDASGAAFGDVNNDGRLDLFTGNFADPADDRLFIGQGDGTFTRVQTGPPVGDTAFGAGAVWLDYDRDGNLDLFVANERPNNFLYHGNGDGTFTPRRTGELVSRQLEWCNGAAATDVNGDGFPDIFIARNQSAEGVRLNDALFLNFSGTGNFQRVAEGPEVKDASMTLGVSFADLNNDGNMDIIAGHYNPSPHTVYLGNGDGTFVAVLKSGLEGDRGRRGSPETGDFNNDGRFDVYFSHSHGDRNTFYLGKGDGTFQRVTSGVGSADGGGQVASNDASAADYDNDGWLDLVVANAFQNPDEPGTAAACFLYHNQGGTDNGWVEIKLIGSHSNRSAIGARLRLEARIWGNPVAQIREVSGGDGFASQPDQKLHFGLGDAQKIDSVRIIWPSGFVQELRGLALKQIHTIIEPPKVKSAGRGRLRVISWTEADHIIEASEDFKAWRRIGATKGGAEFTDPEGSSAPTRFYRAVLAP